MNLPANDELGELNRILAAVSLLSVSEQGCTPRAVHTYCASSVFNGRPVNYQSVLRLCKHARLLIVEKHNIRLTELGAQFLDLNDTKSFELTPGQKKFVAQLILSEDVWNAGVRGLFLLFSPNYSAVTFEFDSTNLPIPRRHVALVYLLLHLGVLSLQEKLLRVLPDYVAPVRAIRAERTGLSSDEFYDALQSRQKLGDAAEIAVLNFERQRLRSVGKLAEADLVRRISDLAVDAGYDIESFDGELPILLEHDRFIEVKGAQQTDVRFYWSANEIERAQTLGEHYWIYFVGDMKDAQHIRPVMIQNPATRLEQIQNLQQKIASILVTQSGDLDLQPIVYGDGIGGYLL